MAKNQVRKWLRLIHRDMGYLCAGLTVIYALSGIAVNHAQDWNPNVTIERSVVELGFVQGLSAEEILDRIGEPRAHKSTFRPNPQTLQIFAEDSSFTVNLVSGRTQIERTQTRPLIYQSNFLHLNHAKKWWTWMADAFAICLTFLAISGLFMIKGKKGFSGRGKWFALAGVGIPIAFWWLYLP